MSIIDANYMKILGISTYPGSKTTSHKEPVR